MFVASIEPLEELTESLASFAQQLDAGALLPADAVRVIELSTKAERLATGLRLAATAVVDRSGVWEGHGDRTLGAWMARTTGTSMSDAIGTVATAQQLVELPDTAAAVARAELSPAQVREVAGAATADPAAEGRLLAQADKGSLEELRNECKRVRAAADPDPEATHRRIHAARGVRFRTDSDGTWVLTARGTAASGARIEAGLRHGADAFFEQAHSEGRQEPGEAYLFDALEQACADPGGKPMPTGANAKIIVRVDWATLVRGRVAEGETCEVAGIGPVPVSWVNEMSQNAFIAAVLTNGTDICSVTHLGRKFTALQVTALQWRDPECSRLGCSSTVRLELDHVDDWAKTHVTTVDRGKPLCPPDHKLKTDHGWMLVEGPGKQPMVPPGHHDHPLQVAVREARVARIGAAKLCRRSRTPGGFPGRSPALLPAPAPG